MVNRAVALAKRRNPGTEASIFDFLRDILLFKFPPNTDEAGIAEHEHFVMKFQQCTGPIMAKGLEDTAFYIYNRLVALNEVGGEPQHFGIDAGGVPPHQRAQPPDAGRTRCWPPPRTTPSAPRIPARGSPRCRRCRSEWRRALRSWSALNRKHKTVVEGEQAPDANEEYLLYQILLGTWPVASVRGEDGAAASSAFASLSERGARDLRRAHPGVHDQGHQGGEGQQFMDSAQRGVG